MRGIKGCFMRQQGIFDPTKIKNTPVHIIGCGGIGSPTAFILAKMGINKLHLWDDDTICEHNIPNQVFPTGSVGELKVEALRDLLDLFTEDDVTIEVHNEKVNASTRRQLHGIVICGVDSLEARREIWPAIKTNPKIKFYLDGRMGGEACNLYSFNPSDTKTAADYEKTLEGKGEELPCTERAILYTVFMAASLIARQVKRYANGQEIIWEEFFSLKEPNLLYYQFDNHNTPRKG